MGMENGKWRVQKGDCLWNIAVSVYKNGSKWKDIAKANGLPTSGNPIIHVNQLLTLPGVTPGSSSAPTPSPSSDPSNTVRIDWLSLKSGTKREMIAMWSNSKYKNFGIRWQQRLQGKWADISYNENQEFNNSTFFSEQTMKDDAEYGTKMRFGVRAVAMEKKKVGNNETEELVGKTDWAYQEYDFADNPPDIPPTPEFSIDDKNNLIVKMENIPEDLDANLIEIAIYQDDKLKYKTNTIKINTDQRRIEWSVPVDPGHNYKIRARAVKERESTTSTSTTFASSISRVYSGWTDFTSNEASIPSAPGKINTIRAEKIGTGESTRYGVYLAWEAVATAETYTIEYTDNMEYFNTPGSGGISSVDTQDNRTSFRVDDIEPGSKYFFRIKANNSKGSSTSYSPVASIIIGEKPSAPTTWSNVSAAIMGEDINLYWTHNSTDASKENDAVIHYKIVETAKHSNVIKESEITVKNNREEEETTGYYTINTSSSEWSQLADGYTIIWKVKTSGISGEYSNWSVEREIDVYEPAELTIDIVDQNGNSLDIINEFPFYISLAASPRTQEPISYYIEIISNGTYETVDKNGVAKMVNAGDKIYQMNYDPPREPWNFMLAMTPNNIDLENGGSYTIHAYVSMNSGLEAFDVKNFKAEFTDLYYDVFADILVDKKNLTASIHPYCNSYEETEEGIINPVLLKNCTLAVYRREYDGKFTEIASNIPNNETTYVVDPHPSLDYARYRIVATTTDTGAISFADVPGVEIKDPAIVIQWGEAWSQFDYDDSGEGNAEPSWSGSMIKIPYNVDVSESKSKDISLINYAGRENPVSYYGTQINEGATWNCAIPAEDKDLIYQLRRLSRYQGDCYVREPSGVGYWANIEVSFSKNHLEVIIPVTFTIKRVEGGM